MNLRQKVGVIGGLAALLGAGCNDKEARIEEAKCEIAQGITAAVVYNQVAWNDDYHSLEISFGGAVVGYSGYGEVCRGENGKCYFVCQNGQRISWGGIGDDIVNVN